MDKQKCIDLLYSLDLSEEEHSQLKERIKGVRNDQLEKLYNNLLLLKKAQQVVEGDIGLLKVDDLRKQAVLEVKKVVQEVIRDEVEERDKTAQEEIIDKIQKM